MNMVRAGVVSHPSEWAFSGYREIQSPPQRYALVHRASLIALTGMTGDEQLKAMHREWINQAVSSEDDHRQEGWSEAVAIGSEGFVDQIKRDMGVEAVGRSVKTGSGIHMLRKPDAAYSLDFDTKTGTLSAENRVSIDVNHLESIG